MSTRPMKTVSDSRSIQNHMVMPGDANNAHILFGGRLLSWMDELAGVVALRHCNAQIVTVAIDDLEFKKSAIVTDVLTLEGRVTWVGTSSFEVRIDTWRENKDTPKQLINTAYFVMVCMEDNLSKSREVPGLLLQTPEEVRDWEAGVRRNALRKQRKKDNY